MFTWQWARNVKQNVLRFVSLKKHIPILNALSNDKEIPKCATHLVYLTSSTRADKVEEEIISSIYYQQPKRADVYWLLHIEVTDQPDTSSYVVETIEKNEVMRITYYLGFRVVPRINILFRNVLNELYANGEFETSDTWKIFYKHNPAGDYRFVVLDNYLSNDNELPLWKKIPLRIYYFLKKVGVPVEESYNLDYSLVTTEKVPLLLESPNLIKLKRIKEESYERKQ